MNVKTCKRCRRIFQYITGKPICPKCRKAEEEIFQVVKEYLRKNVGANMEEVSEATGASLGMIQDFLREGRLEVTADSPIALGCEKCGTTIRSGRLCNKCRESLSHALQGVANSMKPDNIKQKEKERMRFLDSLDK